MYVHLAVHMIHDILCVQKEFYISFYQLFEDYRQVSNIRRSKSQH